jgi:hypothetical protein
MTPQEIANTPGLGSGGIGISGGGENATSKEKAKGVIYEQIKGQSENLGTAKTFQTGAAGTKEGGLGSVDAVMWDMAERLSDVGLTSIEQFGREQVKDPVLVYPELSYAGWLGGSTTPTNPNNTAIAMLDGENYIIGYLEYAPTGRWYTRQDYGDSEGSYLYSSNTFLSPQEIASYGLTGKGKEQTVMMDQGRTAFINKETGEELTAKLPGWDGQGWGGTSAGDGQTVYDVNFDPTTGLPIFYNRQTHGRDKYAGLLKAAAIGTAIFAPQIGAAILGASAPAAAALAVGSAISGFIGSGGNIEQGIKSGLAAYLGGRAGSWASRASNSALVGNIASNMTRTAILGGDMSTALVSSLVQAAPAEIVKHFPNFSSLPRAAQEAAVAATVDLMRTGGDNLDTIAIKGATDGLTDYTLKQIPGYSDLRKGQQDVVRERVSNVVRGESLTNEVLQGAIQMGAEAVRYQADTDRAVKDGWSSLEQQQSAQSLYGPKVTPDQFADKQNTTEAEAKQIARDILGREPTEFEYMQLIGLPEREAAQNSNLAAIKYDESTFDSNELAETYRALYGREPTKEFLESPEALDMLGRSDAQGKAALNEFYTKDKNWVTENEAQQFWRDAGNKGSMPQTFMDELLMTSEAGAKAMSETYRIRKEDLDATTFDGTKYKDQKEAQAAAIKEGYNNYTFGDKNYYLMSQDQAETLKKDIAAGKTAGPKPDAFFTSVPGMSLEQQLAAAGNPDSYAYQQGDVIYVVAKRLPAPSYNDLEAWNEFKEEKKAAGGDNFRSFLTEQFSILEQAMKGAPKDSVNNVLANAAMFGYGKMAQMVEAFSRTGEAAGVPQAERATNIAKQVQSWSNKLVDQGIQNAESAVLANVAAVTRESIAAEKGVRPSDISTTELYAKKTAALFKQVPNNPLGVSLFLVGEGIQEIPLLAASGGVGSVFKNVIGKSVGMSAAVGTNVALNGAEGFGGNYGEVKEYLQKQGVPDSQIEALAVKSGFEAMAASMLTSYVGDRALIKSFMGDLAKDSFGKVIATNSTKEWFLGNFEGSLQNMSAQIGKYGSIKSEDEWLNAGIMEGFAQKGIAAGVLTADALSRVVAKDYDGKPVTFKQIIDGEKTFDPKTIDRSFSYGTGVNLGDAIGYHSTFLTNPNITPDEYFYTAQTFRQNGMNDFTPQEIASIVGGAGELSPQQVSEIALPYAQERVVTKEEAQQMMRDLGYTNMTDAEAMSLAGQISETAAREKVRQYVDPRQVTRSEAEEFFKSIPGYNPTEADIAAFVRQGADVNQEAVRGEIVSYTDARMVNEQEARAAYAALGLAKPTQADVLKLVGQYDQTDLTGKATANLDAARYNSILSQLDSLSVGASKETLDAIALVKKDLNSQITALGGDVKKLESGVNSVVTELSQTEKDILAEVAKNEAAGMSRDAALQKAINTVAATQKTDTASLLSRLGKTEATLLSEMESGFAGVNEQYNTLSAAQKATADALVAQGKTLQDAIAQAKTETTGQIAGVETRLTDAIAAAEAMGLSRDQAITAAVESVAADLGTTKADLLAQLGTTEQALRTEFETGISGLEAQTKAQYDALTAEQKALANQLTQQGVDLTTAIATAQAQTQQQISDLGVEVDARINELMLQGQTYQQATQQAFAEVNAKNQEMAGLIGTQGRTASQQDIDALNQMLSGQRSMDLAYDVTGDKQITQADIDFLTQVVGGVKTDWTAPQQSPWAATGLYGQIQANELQRQRDLADAEAQRVADQQAAAEAARKAEVRGNIRTTVAQGEQQLQNIQQQLPQALRMAQEVSTPIYGQMGPYLDVGSDLDFGFFQPSPEKQAGTKRQQPTKIAAGGYIDDLLAGDMKADDLLNLLR